MWNSEMLELGTEMSQWVGVLAGQARGPEFKSPVPMWKSQRWLHAPVTLALSGVGAEMAGSPELLVLQFNFRSRERTCVKGMRMGRWSRTHSLPWPPHTHATTHSPACYVCKHYAHTIHKKYLLRLYKLLAGCHGMQYIWCNENQDTCSSNADGFEKKEQTTTFLKKKIQT